jgi:hypothetical protein
MFVQIKGKVLFKGEIITNLQNGVGLFKNIVLKNYWTRKAKFIWKCSNIVQNLRQNLLRSPPINHIYSCFLCQITSVLISLKLLRPPPLNQIFLFLVSSSIWWYADHDHMEWSRPSWIGVVRIICVSGQALTTVRILPEACSAERSFASARQNYHWRYKEFGRALANVRSAE